MRVNVEAVRVVSRSEEGGQGGKGGGGRRDGGGLLCDGVASELKCCSYPAPKGVKCCILP